MKTLLFFLTLMIFSLQVSAGRSPSAAGASGKTLAGTIDGKWIGFCSPHAMSGTSKQCNYTFQKNGSGEYQCEFFKDLRCTTKDSKTTSDPFRYTIQGGDDKVGKISVEYSTRSDIRQEKSRAYITRDVLRLQVYEVLRMPEVPVEKLEEQGVLPYFEFTRGK